jgi:metal-responsive CopG/Arc/MetJ family transcriptional regulator
MTLSLPKALLKKAKTLAIRKDRSLSDLLRSALEEKVKEESDPAISGRGTARLRSWRGDLIRERRATRP